MNCIINDFLAQIMFVYFGASIIYFISTRFVDTPFYDSLNTKQKKIKKKSSYKRGIIFLVGILISIFILVLVDPFKKCYDR